MRMKKQIKHWGQTLATYVYNYCNISIYFCNIAIYFCNIRMKHLQHTSKITEIFKLYTCKMHRIPMRPPPPSASGRQRAVDVVGGKAGGLPCQGLALLLALAMHVSIVGAGWVAKEELRQEQRDGHGARVENTEADATDANGETVPMRIEEDMRNFFLQIADQRRHPSWAVRTIVAHGNGVSGQSDALTQHFHTFLTGYSFFELYSII
jgi:hypothetical protein